MEVGGTFLPNGAVLQDVGIRMMRNMPNHRNAHKSPRCFAMSAPSSAMLTSPANPAASRLFPSLPGIAAWRLHPSDNAQVGSTVLLHQVIKKKREIYRTQRSVQGGDMAGGRNCSRCYNTLRKCNGHHHKCNVQTHMSTECCCKIINMITGTVTVHS